MELVKLKRNKIIFGDMELMRIISKEGKKWKVQHHDGQITYHKTLRAAKDYKHELLVIDPFPNLQEN